MAKYTTVGAISGHFPSDAERAANTEIAALSYGAQSHEATVAEMQAGSRHAGKCPVCERTLFAPDSIENCKCCASRRNDPAWTIHTDGTWWKVECLAEAIAAGEA